MIEPRRGCAAELLRFRVLSMQVTIRRGFPRHARPRPGLHGHAGVT